MKFSFSNLWNFWKQKEEVVICITTNGTVKKNGEAVMGKGCALEAKLKFSNFPIDLGYRIKKYGNNIHCFSTNFGTIVTFPTKHNYWEQADIKLIERSCQQLVKATNQNNWQKIILPQPGCGAGGLKWEEVKPILEKYFDDRFEVVTNV